jgi:hypothetical protein
MCASTQTGERTSVILILAVIGKSLPVRVVLGREIACNADSRKTDDGSQSFEKLCTKIRLGQQDFGPSPNQSSIVRRNIL